MDAWVVEVLRVGYRIPFDRQPPLSERPLSLPAYYPQSIKGVALTQELQSLLRKGAVEPAPQSPGFYSHLFLVQKTSGSWRPIIDLSTLNDYVTSSHFHMETPQSVLRSIRPGDWMVSLDLQDAYLQVPVHHDSRRYLRFVVEGRTYQFRVLCFGLTTAPQVFTRIMAPVSAILHKYGVRMLRYLDDWLILASSELACLQSRDRLLTVCTELGIQVNLTKSSLVPTQSLVYLGMEIRSLPFIARPTPVRVSNLLRLIEEFLSTTSPPASTAGPLVVPHSSRLWRDAQNEAAPTLPQGPVGFPGRPVSGLLVPSLSRGSSLVGSSGTAAGGSESLSPSSRRQLLLRRLGCRLGGPGGRTPCLGSSVSSSEDSLHQPERVTSSSVRPAGLRTSFSGPVGSAVLRQHHHSRLSSPFRRDVLLHSERHGEGDTPLGRESPCPSPASIHHGLVQCHSGRSESSQSGDGSEWTLHQEVVDHLVHKWPAVIDLFATSLTARLPVYFSPASDSQAAGTDALLQPWDNLQAYSCPPIAIIRRVPVKLRSSRNCELTLIAPFWPQREWFPDLLELLSDVPITLSSRKDLLRQPQFHQNLPMLQLTAWRLSSDSPVRPASLLRWLDNLSSVEDSPHA